MKEGQCERYASNRSVDLSVDVKQTNLLWLCLTLLLEC